MKELKILIIDDEKLIRWSFEKQLNTKGYQVFTAESGEEGLKLAEINHPEIIFVDNKLPKMQGLEVISKIRSLDEDVIIIFMTAYGSIEIAINAIKSGASEYINKPFSFEEIHLLLENIKSKFKINNELQVLRRQQKDTITFDHIVGKSHAIKQIIQLSKKIAKTNATTVLLLGESGTGKDLFAKAIHNESARKNKPFVTINCASLPENLLESELFGYEKGAFTDAKQMKKGLFEIAEGGTVFLDEIGEINHSTQVKLLGVLENRTIRRVGGTVNIPVEIRVIAATNKNLKKSIEEKLFREDLFYRLQVFQITLPPLRDHKEDIPYLIDYFINHYNIQFRKKVEGIDKTSLENLESYSWPGNIRELRNVIERAVILESHALLQSDSLPTEIVKIHEKKNNYPSQTNTLFTVANFELPEEGISLYELERKVIEQALRKAENNQTKASKLLGISRDVLRYKTKKYDLL